MEDMTDPFDLVRFLKAQNPLLQQVLQALQAGQKRSHWMWLIFPPLAGPGSSPMAQLTP